MTENRELGPELTAEGWWAIGDGMLWYHEPSHWSVTVETNWRRNQCLGCYTLPSEPVSPDTVGCLVGACERSVEGEPIQSAESLKIWTERWVDAIRMGREIRQQILNKRPRFEPVKQLTFDDLLDAKS
jgi:hypothetical protein